MTIKDAVKEAIAAMPGNKPFLPRDLDIVHIDGKDDRGVVSGIMYLSSEQISRAIRDLPHVRRKPYHWGYRVKGRRVPPK